MHNPNQSINTDLNWSCGDPDAGDTLTYDVYFRTSTTPALVSNDQAGTTWDPGTQGYNATYYWKVIATDNYGASTSGPLWNFTTSPAHASTGAVSGTITYASNGTEIQGVTVNLSINGTVIASKATDSNGNFIMSNLSPCTYTLTASKITFWSNSSSVTVNAGETTTVSLMLWRKGDLNNDGTAADAGDLAIMKDASVDKITPDWKDDLNTNGIFVDAGDSGMLKDASAGNIELL